MQPPARDVRLGGPWGARDRWIADLRARGVHQRRILFAGLAGMFAGMFPFTVLAVSLKNIASELGSTETTLAWVVTAPILFSAIALLAGLYAGADGFRLAFFAGGVMALLALCTAAFMKKDQRSSISGPGGI